MSQFLRESIKQNWNFWSGGGGGCGAGGGGGLKP